MMRVASLKNRSVRAMSLPTAHTPKVGTLYRIPALMTWFRLSRLLSWPSAPMKVWTAIQSAFMRMASSMFTATTSWLRSSWSMDEPEVTRRAMLLASSGATQVRMAPRVPMKQST